jgi:hypothetical protein
VVKTRKGIFACVKKPRHFKLSAKVSIPYMAVLTKTKKLYTSCKLTKSASVKFYRKIQMEMLIIWYVR